jgi:phospholipid/cholesterol/gamma-HCH transport system substrate-binding protein
MDFSGLRGIRAAAVSVATVLTIGACSSTQTAAVTVLWRPGTNLQKDATVTLHGTAAGNDVEVGKVVEVDLLPDKTVAHLKVDPELLQHIPANVLTKIVSPTAVQFIPPANPAPQPIHDGTVLQGG